MNNGHNDDIQTRMERAERIIALLVDMQEENRSELRALAASQVVMNDTLTRFMASTGERFAETTDKLNAVIDLMDRHIREHGGAQ